MVEAYIGLGSNLDEPIKQVQQALQELAQLPESRFIRASSLYRSKPMGPQDQADFINAVACLETALNPWQLLDELHQLEQRHQRVRQQHWGPRTLDLDILLYGDDHIHEAQLIIPHVGLGERNFVLYPLQEIMDEQYFIPGMGTLAELIGKIPSDGLERLASS